MNEKDVVDLVEVKRVPNGMLELAVEPKTAEEIVAWGNGLGWTFKKLPYSGILTTKMGNDKWTYEPYVNQPMPKEAKRRLDEVLENGGAPIVQIIYAHEVKKKREIDWERVKEISVNLGKAVGIVALVAMGIMALPVIALAAVALYDPAIIVVIEQADESGERSYPWLEVCSWV